jgi:riboflavin biosynthesis pyrimidine reductase
MGSAVIAGIDSGRSGDEATQVLRLLRARGCARVFVEGGGVTVSTFLEANLLDRLQIAIAPVLIGDGRPAIRLTPQARLRDCRRPGYRVFRMGGDVLFDCELNLRADTAPGLLPGTVNRII